MGASMRALDEVPKARCKDFLSILDFNHEELAQAVALASRLKRERPLGLRAPTSHALDGRHIGLLFEKPLHPPPAPGGPSGRGGPSWGATWGRPRPTSCTRIGSRCTMSHATSNAGWMP